MEIPKRIGLSDMDSSKYITFGSIFILGVDCLLFPLDTLKTIVMADRRKKLKSGAVYKSPNLFKLTRQIYKNEGLKRFWRGMLPSVTGGYPGQASYYLAYETVHELMNSSKIDDAKFKTFIHGFIAGAAAELAGGLFYVPADIIAQRLQVQQVQGFVHNSRLYSNSWDVIKKVWRNEGYRGFFRGYGAYITAYAPGSAVQWGTYEFSKGLWFNFFTRLENQNLINKMENKEFPVNLISSGIASLCAICANNPLEILRIRTQLLESKNRKDAESIRAGYFKLGYNIWKEEGWQGSLDLFKPFTEACVSGYWFKVHQ